MLKLIYKTYCFLGNYFNIETNIYKTKAFILSLPISTSLTVS